MAAILIVEDDPGINELLKRTLEKVGYVSFQAFCGLEALQMLQKKTVDLILLDINLPDMSGFDCMKKIDDIPIICVTARDELSDKVRGLYGGAEDYITKPFDIEELLARIQVVLKRFQKEENGYYIGELFIDVKKRKVLKNQELVALTAREFELLLALISNKNMALSRSRLLDIAWGMDYDGEERTVDVHIQRIRKKLGLEESLKTIFKYGYRLEI